jgi:two-component system response regulator HydG
MKMPERDGMYLMREVKKEWPDIPIIVMSGYYTTETIKEAAEMGAATFIAKPFEPDELVKTIRQVMQKEKRHGKKEDPRHR